MASPIDDAGHRDGVLDTGGEFGPDPPPPAPDPPPSPGRDVTAPTIQWQAPVGNDQEFVTSAGNASWLAAAGDGVGINRVEFGRYNSTAED